MLFTIWWKRRSYSVAQVDVFSGSAFIWAQAAGWLLGLLGKPFILTLHGGSLPEFAEANPGRVTRLLRSARIVTVPSKFLYEKMRPYGDCVILPNAMDFSSFHFSCRTQPLPSLVWLRAFEDIYNPTLAVKVLSLLMPKFPEIRLSMIGPDKGDGALERVRAAAKDLGVHLAVSFMGAVPKVDVPRALAKGDIFLNTTNTDNTPVSVLEAMACGMCVVSTDVGGIPYLLAEANDALLVPPDDAPAMAQAVERLLCDPKLSAKVSANAREKARAYDWEAVLPLWEEYLVELIKDERT
jgi:glycosyltransferase involved in cell wall biosynthesis